MEWLRKADHRSTGAPVAVSRALATGGREKQNMDVLRASQGRVSMDDLRGIAAHPCERPARCAGLDRAAALTERRATPGRQGAASKPRTIAPLPGLRAGRRRPRFGPWCAPPQATRR